MVQVCFCSELEGTMKSVSGGTWDRALDGRHFAASLYTKACDMLNCTMPHKCCLAAASGTYMCR